MNDQEQQLNVLAQAMVQLQQLAAESEQGDQQAQAIMQEIQKRAQAMTQQPTMAKRGAKLQKHCAGKKLENGAKIPTTKVRKASMGCPCTLHRVGGKLIEVDCNGIPVNRGGAVIKYQNPAFTMQRTNVGDYSVSGLDDAQLLDRYGLLYDPRSNTSTIKIGNNIYTRQGKLGRKGDGDFLSGWTLSTENPPVFGNSIAIDNANSPYRYDPYSNMYYYIHTPAISNQWQIYSYDPLNKQMGVYNRDTGVFNVYNNPNYTIEARDFAPIRDHIEMFQTNKSNSGASTTEAPEQEPVRSNREQQVSAATAAWRTNFGAGKKGTFGGLTYDEALARQQEMQNAEGFNVNLGRAGADGKWGSTSQSEWNRYQLWKNSRAAEPIVNLDKTRLTVGNPLNVGQPLDIRYTIPIDITRNLSDYAERESGYEGNGSEFGTPSQGATNQPSAQQELINQTMERYKGRNLSRAQFRRAQRLAGVDRANREAGWKAYSKKENTPSDKQGGLLTNKYYKK